MSSAQPKLQTVIAHAGITSRRKAEELITAGVVTVNGTVATLSMRANPTTDQITVNGQPLPTTEASVSYLLNKPAGFVSTTSDELGRPTVLDYLQQLLPPGTKLPRLYPVGRLDLDSEGLMLLTNDGDLTYKLTHPSYEVPKTYQVYLEGFPSDKALAHLEKGVKLTEGMTAPALVHEMKRDGQGTWVEITIHEGRYHQVKRMFQRVGYEVLRLIRVKMGPFELSQLSGNKYKLLQPEETQIAAVAPNDYSRKALAQLNTTESV